MISSLRCLPLLLLFVSSCHAQQGETSSITVCSNTAVTVTQLQVTCDSPGTFYYGSGGYRNSKYCNVGDKAHVVVYFDINQQQDVMFVTLTCFATNQKVQIYQKADVCSVSNHATSSLNGSSNCPAAGSYKLETHFYFQGGDNARNDKGYSSYSNGSDSLTENTYFVPTVMVGFSSVLDNRDDEFDLGGANLDKCAGNSRQEIVASYPASSNQEALVNFAVCMAILLSILCLLVFGIWFVFVKTTSSSEAGYLEEDLMA